MRRGYTQHRGLNKFDKNAIFENINNTSFAAISRTQRCQGRPRRCCQVFLISHSRRARMINASCPWKKPHKTHKNQSAVPRTSGASSELFGVIPSRSQDTNAGTTRRRVPESYFFHPSRVFTYPVGVDECVDQKHEMLTSRHSITITDVLFRFIFPFTGGKHTAIKILD